MSRNKRAKHSKTTLYPLFDAYVKSEEGREHFCNRHGIALHNYNYWWAKYRKEKGLQGVSKNKGRNKAVIGGTQNNTPISVQSKGQAELPGEFIAIEKSGASIAQVSPTIDAPAGLTIKLGQGIELSFTGLPPVRYVQSLLTVYTNH